MTKYTDDNVSEDGHNTAGIDVGSTLTKIATTDESGKSTYQYIYSNFLGNLDKILENIPPDRIGLTGAGAHHLKKMFPGSSYSDEFKAWSRGYREIRASSKAAFPFPLLLAVVGTGTSFIHLQSHSFGRAGGTALGGGTLMGLGKALTGVGEFNSLATLASKGSRENVDLQIRDIYGDRGIAEIGLPKSVTASNLAKLGSQKPIKNEDCARGLMGLIGENVALIGCHLAHSKGLERILYAGSTLNNNTSLVEVLLRVSEATGIRAKILEGGEYSGAIGARLLALERLLSPPTG